MTKNHKILIAALIGAGLWWWLTQTCKGRAFLARILGRTEKPCCAGCADHGSAELGPLTAVASNDGGSFDLPGFHRVMPFMPAAQPVEVIVQQQQQQGYTPAQPEPAPATATASADKPSSSFTPEPVYRSPTPQPSEPAYRSPTPVTPPPPPPPRPSEPAYRSPTPVTPPPPPPPTRIDPVIGPSVRPPPANYVPPPPPPPPPGIDIKTTPTRGVPTPPPPAPPVDNGSARDAMAASGFRSGTGTAPFVPDKSSSRTSAFKVGQTEAPR